MTDSVCLIFFSKKNNLAIIFLILPNYFKILTCILFKRNAESIQNTILDCGKKSVELQKRSEYNNGHYLATNTY